LGFSEVRGKNRKFVDVQRRAGNIDSGSPGAPTFKITGSLDRVNDELSETLNRPSGLVYRPGAKNRNFFFAKRVQPSRHFFFELMVRKRLQWNFSKGCKQPGVQHELLSGSDGLVNQDNATALGSIKTWRNFRVENSKLTLELYSSLDYRGSGIGRFIPQRHFDIRKKTVMFIKHTKKTLRSENNFASCLGWNVRVRV
jgi:hypothetical protein